MIFVGIDWSERHHDICVLDAEGAQLARARVPEGIEGLAELHGTLAEHAEAPEEVIVGIETDRLRLDPPYRDGAAGGNGRSEILAGRRVPPGVWNRRIHLPGQPRGRFGTERA